MTRPRSTLVDPQHPLEVIDGNRSFGTVRVLPGGAIHIATTEDVSIEILDLAGADAPSAVVRDGDRLEITDGNRTFDTVRVLRGGAILISTTEDTSIATLEVD